MKNQCDNTTLKYHGNHNCSVYDDADFRKLLSGSLPEIIETQLRHHCETCDDCAAQLSVVARIVDQEENNELLKKAMAVMNRIDCNK